MNNTGITITHNSVFNYAYANKRWLARSTHTVVIIAYFQINTTKYS